MGCLLAAQAYVVRSLLHVFCFILLVNLCLRNMETAECVIDKVVALIHRIGLGTTELVFPHSRVRAHTDARGLDAVEWK